MEYDIYFIIDEIIKIIKDNLELMTLNDNYLIELKEYCEQDKFLKFTPYADLIYFVEEALRDLIDVDFLYDFRDIE